MILLALGTSAASATSGQTAFASLEEVWKYADAHNVSIRNAQYETDKATYGRRQSYAALLPTISATGSVTDNTALQTTLIPASLKGGPDGVYFPVQFGQKYIYAGGITAQLDIVNLQTWMNVRIARETEELNKASLGNTRRNTYQQIATQYYGYLLNKEAARLAAQSRSIADSVLQSVSNKYSEGTVNMANVDIAKLNEEKAEQTLINASYQMRTAANAMKSLLNMAVTDSLEISSNLDRDMSTNSDAAFAEDPSVRVALHQSKVNLAQYRSANTSFAPTLSLIYSNTEQLNDSVLKPFRSGLNWYPARYYALRASWNIFTGGSRWLQAKKSRINYEESELQLDNTRKQAAINDENLRLGYSKATALAKKAEHIMNLSFDNYQHISYRYEAGMTSIEERLNAFTDYITYQNQYLNSLSDLLVQLYQMKIRQQSF